MKTIQVNDEDYEFLKEIIYELKFQDNRFTADPIYLVREKVREPRPEEYGSDGVFYVEKVTGDYYNYDNLITISSESPTIFSGWDE